MKQKPKILLVYACVLILIVLSMPFQAAQILDVSILEVGIWYKQLTWLNLIMAASLLLTSFLAFRAHRALLYMAPVTFLLVALNNLWVAYVGLNFSFGLIMSGTFGFLACHVIFLDKKVRHVLLNPKTHWWRAAERKKLMLPIAVHPWVGETMNLTTHDISLGGAFVPCDNAQVKVGDRMQIKLNIDGFKDIRCTARVVRRAESRGSYPSGFGIQFERLGRAQKIFIEHLLLAH